MQLTIARDMDGLQDTLIKLVSAGKRIGLVPTMGALHDGHMALVRQAQQLTDAVVASVFVNPKQFGPNEDLNKYPRMLDSDIEKLDKAGVAAIYAPGVEDMYPEGFSTTVSAGPLADILCGRSRPGHFNGVATVVSKLLLRTLPHTAVFGEKDYQQLCIIRRVVSDLDIPVDIVGVPTQRETDGLAMSSRNAYLSEKERQIAPKLHGVLSNVGIAIVSGSLPLKAALDHGIATLTKAGFKVDYVDLREADTLEPMEHFEAPARLLAAAWLGNTRLIDNIALE